MAQALFGDLDSAERKRLARILGQDAGPNPHDWFVLYDAVAPTLSTPLSKEQVAEMDRVAAAFGRYGEARNRARTAGLKPLPAVNWDAVDLDAEIDRFVAVVAAQSPSNH